MHSYQVSFGKFKTRPGKAFAIFQNVNNVFSAQIWQKVNILHIYNGVNLLNLKNNKYKYPCGTCLEQRGQVADSRKICDHIMGHIFPKKNHMKKINIVCKVHLCNTTFCVLQPLNNTKTVGEISDFMIHHGGRGG